MDIYQDEERQDLFEADELSDFEMGFMEGYCHQEDFF